MTTQEHGTRFSATATHATAAVATQTGATGKKSFITDISASSDKAGSIILVKDGTTVIWQDIVGAGNYRHQFSTPLTGSVDADVSVTIDGTSACKANIAGYFL
jgi:hypothetical protein